jgi:hypothetical protein
MKRQSRRFQVTVLIVVMAIAWCQPQTASAWFGRWRGGFYGVGFRPWCGPIFGPRFYGGWGGYGGVGGFYSGSVSSYVIGPRWCGPAFGPRFFGGWGGGYGLPCTYYPVSYGCGGFGYAPIVVSPYGGAIAPVYGPAGVLPFMGVSTSTLTTRVQSIAASGASQSPAAQLAALVPARQAGAPPSPQLALGNGNRNGNGDAATAIAVRPSNGVARLRAARLVAVGDRHLRTAVHDPATLAAALDAYRRAATIAADQADTFLRQAIVLTALGRAEDAARAVDRAVSVDARLGSDPQSALAAQQHLPPDPVFGDRPDAGPTTLASRSTGLLVRIFREPAAVDGPAAAAEARANWIADRWSRQWQGHEQIDAVAAR